MARKRLYKSVFKTDFALLERLSMKELRNMAKWTSKVLNARLSRIRKRGWAKISPAVLKLGNKRKFSYKKKTKKELLRELEEMKRFDYNQTSTIKGIIRANKRIRSSFDADEEIDEDFDFESEEMAYNERFWRNYRKFEESHQGLMDILKDMGFGSDKMVDELSSIMEDATLTDDEILEAMEKRTNELYEEFQTGDDTDVFDF